jgi:predicted CoA-binding protein
MDAEERIERFLDSEAFAVAGAARNRDKYGNKVLRCYLQHGRTVYPVNARANSIEGLACLAAIESLPQSVQSLSIITPPVATEQIVREAIRKGIKNIWLQPGAESPAAIEACQQAGINVIAGGPCILKTLGYDDAWVPG